MTEIIYKLSADMAQIKPYTGTSHGSSCAHQAIQIKGGMLKLNVTQKERYTEGMENGTTEKLK